MDGEPEVSPTAAYFINELRRVGEHGPLSEVMQLLASESLTPQTFAMLVERHGVRAERWFRSQVLDLMLGYLRHLLRIGPLTEADGGTIRALRKSLDIPDGEFMSRRPAEVAAILAGC